MITKKNRTSLIPRTNITHSLMRRNTRQADQYTTIVDTTRQRHINMAHATRSPPPASHLCAPRGRRPAALHQGRGWPAGLPF